MLRTLASGAALLLVLSAPAPASARVSQDVRIEFEDQDGKPDLRVFSSVPFAIEPRSLSFTVRPYAGLRPDPSATTQPIAVEVGPAVILPSGSASYHAYTVPIAVAAPARSGMYELSVEASNGFARDATGAALPVTQFPLSGIGSIAAWWPDESAGDAGLRDIRARFAQRVVHGFGGIVFACLNWGTGVGPETGVRLGAVTRETGGAAVLTIGSTWGSDVGFRFLAFDPLALRIADPAGALPREVKLPACEFVLRYADPWHVDTALTTARPPPLNRPNEFPIRPGMSRDEVIWRMGYPNEYGTVTSFRAQDHWSYVSPTPFSWSVTFAHDRVVAVDPPGRMPG
jgi:hypothetical protein